MKKQQRFSEVFDQLDYVPFHLFPCFSACLIILTPVEASPIKIHQFAAYLLGFATVNRQEK